MPGRSAHLRSAALAALLAFATGACASLDGLSASVDASSDAAESDTSVDSGRGDARSDARPRDAGYTDATAKDGGHDASHDAARSDASDADTGSGDVACVPYTPPDAEVGAVCVSPDAGDGGTCEPALITAPLTHVPPMRTLGRCTPEDLDALYIDCFTDQGSADLCDNYIDAPATGPCYDCTFGQHPYGPYLLTGNSGYLPNIGGCIELTDPCQTPCGLVIEQQFLCETASCIHCAADLDTECIEGADTCACAAIYNASGACYGGLTSDPKALACLSTAGDQGAVMKAYGLLFCGPYPDGGAPDAGHDSGAADAPAG